MLVAARFLEVGDDPRDVLCILPIRDQQSIGRINDDEVFGPKIEASAFSEWT